MRTARSCICLLLVVAALTGAATDASARSREAIIWGGAVSSAPFGSDGEQLGGDPRDGVVVGMGLLWNRGAHYAFALDVRYAQKGTKGKVDTRYADADSGYILDATVALDYIEVPLMAALYLELGSWGEIRGYAGGSVNFLVRSSIGGTLDGAHFDKDVNSINGVDYAGVAGATYEYRLKTVAFAFDARFVGSLASIVGDGDVRLRAFEFSLGLGIPLGKDHF